MANILMTRKVFLEDRQGRTFVDVVDDPEMPFDVVLDFFNDADRQRRMEESEVHHDRPPLAGVVRELESQTAIDQFLSEIHSSRTKRLRQAIGVVVRIIMQNRGWRKTGRKGSLGVRAVKTATPAARHNTGGLAFWFIRAERYELEVGMPYRGVRDRCQDRNIVADPSTDKNSNDPRPPQAINGRKGKTNGKSKISGTSRMQRK